MKRKIFISLNLPEQAKKRLSKAIKEWDDLPIKWTKEKNLHLTLAFLGFVPDEDVLKVCQEMRDLGENKDIFDIELDTIELGPSLDDPRMVWLTGKPNEGLLNLVEEIEKKLEIFVSPRKEFRPHITLGKIRKHKWDELSEKPNIKKEFFLTLGAESIDVMASDFEGEGMEYAVVESCPLQ